MCVSVWTNMNVLLHLNKQCVILYLTQRHVNMKNYHIIWRPSLISTDVVGSHHYEEALCLGSTFSLFKLTKSFCISLHKRELCIQCDHITNYFWIYHGIVTDTKKKSEHRLQVWLCNEQCTTSAPVAGWPRILAESPIPHHRKQQYKLTLNTFKHVDYSIFMF